MLFRDLRITLRHLRMSAAVATSHLLDSFLFGVGRLDPLVLTLSAFFVIVLAVAASLLPAQRAASIHPMEALRAE